LALRPAVELGYLSRDGHLILVESTGAAILFRAYRVLEKERVFQFLTLRRTMEPLGTLFMTAYLHRDGWGKAKEPLMKRSALRLYRTKTSHVLVGGTFKKLRYRVPVPGGPPPVQPTFCPPARQPLLPEDQLVRRSKEICAIFHDASIKAVRRRGSVVEVFATEQKEYTDFVLGKVSALLEFPSESAAAAFAKDFPQTEDPASLDPSVEVDIDRSARGWKALPARSRKAALAAFATLGLLQLLATAWGLLYSPAGVAGAVVLDLLLGIMFIPLAAWVLAYRRETESLREKWPKVALERFAKQARGHAGAFVHIAQEMGIGLKADMLDVESLDTYLRGLPHESFFPAFAWGAAAYTGVAFLAAIGRDVEHEWRYNEESGLVVLWFPAAQQWVSPFYVVRRVWLERGPERIHAFLEQFAQEIALRHAGADVPGLTVLGFLRKGWDDVDAFIERLPREVKGHASTTHVLGDNHFHRRLVPFGDFELQYVELELEMPGGPTQRPFLLFPFSRHTTRLRATLEGTSEGVAPREDLAILRLTGNELVPLGVQIYNYLEIGPKGAEKGTTEIDLLAVSDDAQAVTPRMRAMREDAKDFLAPLESSSDGIPRGPGASFMGKVVSREEVMNPFTGIPFWRVSMSMLDLSLSLLVRKDLCKGVPEPGHFLAGSAWLVGRFTAAAPATTSYIG